MNNQQIVNDQDYTLAAIRKYSAMYQGKKIGVIVSSGNVDLSKFGD